MADQHQMGVGIVLGQIGYEVGHIVVELADIADVAVRPRSAMSARIDRHRDDPRRRERFGDHMHFLR